MIWVFMLSNQGVCNRMKPVKTKTQQLVNMGQMIIKIANKKRLITVLGVFYLTVNIEV